MGSASDMPRGWLKHKSRTVGKKASRGGSSHHSSSKHPTRPTRHPKPRRAGGIQEQGASCLIEEVSSRGSDPYFTDDEELVYEYSPNNGTSCSTETPRIKCVSVKEECPICCEIRPLISLMKKCKHPPACRECLHEIYVSQAQENVSNYPLQCYHPQCTKPILASQLISHGIFRSDEELQKHYRFSLLAKAYSRSDKMVAHCPDCDFPKLVSYQDRAQCWKCRGKFEITHDANHNKSSTIQALQAIKTDNIGHNDGWTYCPGCKMIVSKGWGCNHMTCVCGEEFYWDEVTVNPTIKVAVAERPSESRVMKLMP